MQPASPKGYAPRMSLYFGAFFLPFGLYVPFFGLWLNSLGITPQNIGIILMIPFLARAIFTPFTAAIADRIGDRRLTLQIYSVAFAATFALITLDDSLVWIMVVMAISHIAQCAIIPVADSLAMAGTRRFGFDYGRMRSSGTFAFMIANLIGGVVLDTFGAGQIIWVMAGSNILHVIASFTLPADPRLSDNRTLAKGTRLNWNQLKQFAQTSFWITLFATSLVQASHGLLYGFSTIYWREIGIAANLTGLFWAVSGVAEVLLFFFSRKLPKRITWQVLLVIGAVSGNSSMAPLPARSLADCLCPAANHACGKLRMLAFGNDVLPGPRGR